MKGRKPKPAHLHVIDGSARARTNMNPAGRAISAIGTDPPADLDEDAAREWRDLVACAPDDVLRTADANLLRQLAEAVALNRKAKAALDRGQLIIRTVSGNFIQNPFLGVYNRSGDRILKLACELGFSPISRQRMRMEYADQGEADPIEQRFFGKKG